jgi:N-acylneuraminate cytidylyltransferase
MVIAFIPVRGGSKSIPLKNIKLFCGKPLVYWNIVALQLSDYVDKIIVATDSSKIKDVVSGFNFDKVELYDRKPENAVDNASTESVMLEYIEATNLLDSDVFMLVQATSPLTETKHFSEAIDFYQSGKYDSLLSCVKNKRFFWNPDGTSINYDYKNRPRRQDFFGMFMENGAFYINTVKNIKRYKNRLSGQIGIYEMPEYTATEIDEPDDWIILEDLMKQHILRKQKKDYSEVKLVISDVDGVLTDAGMYYSEYGDELKKFNTRDGMAFQLFKENGIKTGIITSENTILVERRAKKLNVDFLIQGKKGIGKLDAAKQICEKAGIPLSKTAFIGDDINDIELMENVGFCFCPSDAVDDVKKVYEMCVLSSKGGDGVVREMSKIILG